MEISERQFNDVITGLKTQLELQRSKTKEVFESLDTCRKLNEELRKALAAAEANAVVPKYINSPRAGAVVFRPHGHRGSRRR